MFNIRLGIPEMKQLWDDLCRKTVIILPLKMYKYGVRWTGTDVAENQIEQAKILKADGKFLILYMGWLPAENIIAKLSEELILKYNPDWNGCNDYRHDVWVPDEYKEFFDIEKQEIFDVQVPFTRETWQGRMKACRGVGASMNPETIAKWEEDHTQMMLKEAPETFNILHYVSYAELKVKK